MEPHHLIPTIIIYWTLTWAIYCNKNFIWAISLHFPYNPMSWILWLFSPASNSLVPQYEEPQWVFSNHPSYISIFYYHCKTLRNAFWIMFFKFCSSKALRYKALILYTKIQFQSSRKWHFFTPERKLFKGPIISLVLIIGASYLWLSLWPHHK